MRRESPTTLAMLTRLGENAPDAALAIVALFGIFCDQLPDLSADTTGPSAVSIGGKAGSEVVQWKRDRRSEEKHG